MATQKYREEHREEIRLKEKLFAQKNKEKISAYQKQYRELHKDERAKSNKEYRARNKERIAEKRKEWEAKNKTHLAAYKKKYAQEHQPEILDYRKWYQAEHPERTRMSSRNRRARAKQCLGSGWTEEEEKQLVEDYGGRCAYCNRPADLQMDHVVPMARGGIHSIDNIVPACKACNVSKGAKPLLVWMYNTRIMDAITAGNL